MAQDLKKSELSGWLSPLFGVSFSILLGLFTVRLASDTIERLVYPFIAPIAAGLGTLFPYTTLFDRKSVV